MTPGPWLDYLALGVVIFGVTVIVVGFLWIHELPAIIAKKRNHPQHHAIEAACGGVNCAVAGWGNSSYGDWEPAGLLRPDWPAVPVYRTALDFGRDPWQPLWPAGQPVVQCQGFEVDTADPSGRTLRLLDGVRLDAGDPPGALGEQWLIFRYVAAGTNGPAPREHRVSSRAVGPERRIVLPSMPVEFPARYGFMLAPTSQPTRMTEQLTWQALRPVSRLRDLTPGTGYYDATGHAYYVCTPNGAPPVVNAWSGARADAVHLVRGLYTVGGNAYGHQKQYGWGTGLGLAAEIFEDLYAGFNSGRSLGVGAGTVVRDSLFRWSQSCVGRGGEVSGFERHTADRIKKPELHVAHCVFDVANTFLFDGNDNPLKNIPFANHHIWERNIFLPMLGGVGALWWDQYCFNNVVQDNVFVGNVFDAECCENFLVRNNIFIGDKGNAAQFRGTDRGYVFNNTTFRCGGVLVDSEPSRANTTEQGQPTYGPSFPMEARGPVPWLYVEELNFEKGISLRVTWLADPQRPEVYYCENWDFPNPMLIDARGFQSFRAASGLDDLTRGSYYHDARARRLYLRQPDGSERPIAFIEEVKLVPAARRGRALLPLLQGVQEWVLDRADASLSVVLDETEVKPNSYTGRLGIKPFREVSRIAVHLDAEHVIEGQLRRSVQQMEAFFGNARDDFRRDAAPRERFTKGEQASGTGHGGKHRVEIERFDRAQIDHLDLPAVRRHAVGRAHGFVDHRAVGDHCRVFSRADDAGLADGQVVAIDCLRFQPAVEKLVFAVDHRIIERGGIDQHVVGVTDGGGRQDDQARILRVKSLHALAVEGARARSASRWQTHDERNRHTRAVVVGRGLVYDLVEGDR